MSEVNRQYSAANKERLNAASKAWAINNAGAVFRRKDAWGAANRDRTRAYSKAYYAAHKAQIAAKQKRRRLLQPEARIARKALWRAVKKGIVVKTVCWVCGEPRVQGHHSSYAKDMQLLVVWLCHTHHQLAHSALIRPHHAIDNC